MREEGEAEPSGWEVLDPSRHGGSLTSPGRGTSHSSAARLHQESADRGEKGRKLREMRRR